MRHGFRQGAVRACIYITRRAYRCYAFRQCYEIFLGFQGVKKQSAKYAFFLYVSGIRTGSLPHCHQQFPSRHRAWSSTNCVQRYTKSPELPKNSVDFCDYSWVLLSPMFIFPFLPSIFILSRYACSTGERVFTWYLRYSRDCNDKKNSKRHMSHGNLRFFSSPHLTPPTLIF